MNYYKILVIAVIIVSIVIGLKIYFSPKMKFYVDANNITVSSSTIKISSELVSYADRYYKIKFLILSGKEKFLLYPEHVVMLRKGQTYKIDKMYDISEISLIPGKQLYLLSTVNEIFPRNRVWRKKYVVSIAKPKLTQQHYVGLYTQPTTYLSHTTVSMIPSTTSVVKPQEISLSTSVISVVKKEEPKLISQKPQYQVLVSTENFLTEYNYDTPIIPKIEIINFTSETTKSTVSILLKNKFEIVISSETYIFSLKPKEKITPEFKIVVPQNISPDEYFLEINWFVNNKKQTCVLPKFTLVDRKPTIVIPEMPKIKYNATNTIIAEVQDDREVKTVNFIEYTPKGQQILNNMILIAGDKKYGIYSFTTHKIQSKKNYKFQIKAVDNIDNTTVTEIYEIPITK